MARTQSVELGDAVLLDQLRDERIPLPAWRGSRASVPCAVVLVVGERWDGRHEAEELREGGGSACARQQDFAVSMETHLGNACMADQEGRSAGGGLADAVVASGEGGERATHPW